MTAKYYVHPDFAEALRKMGFPEEDIIVCDKMPRDARYVEVLPRYAQCEVHQSKRIHRHPHWHKGRW